MSDGEGGVVARFGEVADAYAHHRPGYPEALFDWIAAQVPARQLAWDAGCGSGQATVPLARRFERVVGTDASAAQLAQAPLRADIEYRKATAADSGLADNSADVVTAGQALHWFDRPAFYAEAARVLRPGGLLVAWSYGTPALAELRLQAVLMQFHRGLLAPYWPAGREHVEEGYARLDFPAPRLAVPAFTMGVEWQLDALLGYVASWSAVAAYRAQVGADPMPALAAGLQPLWPAGHSVALAWPLSVLCVRAPWSPTSNPQ